MAALGGAPGSLQGEAGGAVGVSAAPFWPLFLKFLAKSCWVLASDVETT
jgi:hypothetical protein